MAAQSNTYPIKHLLATHPELQELRALSHQLLDLSESLDTLAAVLQNQNEQRWAGHHFHTLIAPLAQQMQSHCRQLDNKLSC